MRALWRLATETLSEASSQSSPHSARSSNSATARCSASVSLPSSPVLRFASSV